MSIPFPRIHIAESVLNRIANALEGDSPLALQMPVPVPPNPQLLGLALDAGLQTPSAPIAAPPGAAQGAFDESVQGGSPLDGALFGGPL